MSRSNTISSTPLFVTVGAVSSALIGGLFIAVFPWPWTVALISAVSFVGLAYLRPAWVFAPCLMLSFYLPSFRMTDVVTMAVMLLAGARVAKEGTLRLALKEIPRVFWLLYAIVAVAVLIGWVSNTSTVPFLYREGRIFLHLLWAVFVLAIFHGDHQVERIGQQVTIVAAGVCLVAVFQAATGIVLVTTGRVGTLDPMSGGSTDSIRVQIPGFTFVMFALVLGFSKVMESAKSLPWRAVLMALFGIGIIVNYGRGLWFWTACAVLLAAVFFRARGILLIALGLLVIVPALALGVKLISPNLVDTVVRRVESTFEEGGGRTSLGWRQAEIADGMDKLAATAGAGVGLGGVYRRPLIELSGRWQDYPRYTHNSYLFLALKLGVLGLVVYLMLLRYVLQRAWWVARHGTAGRADGIALFSFFLCFLGLCVTQPELMEHAGATLVGVSIAMAVALNRERATPQAREACAR